MRRICGASFAVAVVIGASPAMAIDEELRDQPRAPTLPELTHRHPELSVETTFASVEVAASGGVQASEHRNLRIERITFDAPLVGRRWYLGGSYALSLGTRSRGGIAVVPGNPELQVRGAWASVAGVAFGGGLAAIAPTGGWRDDPELPAIASATAAVRGWDRAVFDPNRVTTRAFIDVRDTLGPVVVQYRQAMELAASVRDARQYSLAAVGTVYLGCKLSPLVTVGASVVEYYSLEPEIADASRAHWSIGGDVRLTTRYFLPTVGFDTNLGSPLRALSSLGAPLSESPEAFVSLRIGLTFVVGR